MSSGHERDFLALGIVALGAFKESTDGCRTTQRLPSRFRNQPAHDRRTFPRNVSESVPISGLVLAWNKSEIATDRFSVAKAMRVIHEGSYRLRSANTHTRDTLQQKNRGHLSCPVIQLLFNALQLPIERLDFLQEKISSQLLGRRGEF